MNPYYKYFSFLLLSLFVVLNFSCTKDLELDKFTTDDLNGEWAFPLINATVSLDDLLSDSAGIVSTGSDGLVTLVYEAQNLASIDGSARTSIPDNEKIISESFELPPLGYNLGGQVPVAFDFVFELLHPDHRVDTMYFRSGSYKVGIMTNLNKDEALVSLEVENFIHIETHEPLQVELDMSNPNGEEVFVFTEIDLSHYYVQFDNSAQLNTVYINGVVTFGEDQNPNLSPYYFNLYNEFESIEFTKFVGYVAENEERLCDSIHINIFNSTEFANVNFGPGSVRFNFDVFNSLGLPIELEINRLTALNLKHAQDSVNMNLEPDVIQIAWPDLSQFNQYVETPVQVEILDVNQVLAMAPDMLIVDMSAFVNKGMPSATINHFADNSNLYIDASLEMDLFAGISEMRIEDTLDFDPSVFDQVQQLEFMVNVENGFPIQANVQITFVDENFQELGRLFETGMDLIEAGTIGGGPEYKVITAGKKKSFVMMDHEKIEALKNAYRIVFTAVLSTEEGQFVKIYDAYSMDLNLGAKVVLNY